MESLAEWLVTKLVAQGWSRSEAARRGEISPSMLDKVINGHANAGPEFCRGIARAFKLPPEEVFRRAGLLPSEPEESQSERELLHIFRELPEDERERLKAIGRTLLRERFGRRAREEALAESVGST